MDVRARNRGRPRRKCRFPAAPGGGEKLFGPQASGRQGRDVRAQKVLVYAPDTDI